MRPPASPAGLKSPSSSSSNSGPSSTLKLKPEQVKMLVRVLNNLCRLSSLVHARLMAAGVASSLASFLSVSAGESLMAALDLCLELLPSASHEKTRSSYELARFSSAGSSSSSLASLRGRKTTLAVNFSTKTPKQHNKHARHYCRCSLKFVQILRNKNAATKARTALMRLVELADGESLCGLEENGWVCAIPRALT
eukprot:GABV01001097.1.p1 GENE.GABV01001097.1~~GABV01001097.1.p1  ORF type:complete len:196 (-),score=56.86 GABV01001097.1:134-721(-)